MVALWVFLSIAGTCAERTPADRTVNAALQQHGIEAGQLRAVVIVAWNRVAHDLAVAEDQFLTFKGQRALAMMHLAMHDALNAIVPVYETYAIAGGRHPADPAAAAAQAAHDVLMALYPGQQGALASEVSRWV